MAEDSIVIENAFLLDANRLKDDTTVMLKYVNGDSPEISIRKYLSTPELRSHPLNHSIPLLDILVDPLDELNVIMVFPLLRPIDSPRFATVGECLEFMKQVLEGLAFLHHHAIAHW
ncbi:hypothetical protein FRC03_010720 [Tulasnella sp. 419]|nr:hypothetical protein FRC03_010720 [Tulasnella sp. 419]